MSNPDVETAVQEIKVRGSHSQNVASGMRSLKTPALQSPDAIVDALLEELRGPLLQAVNGAQSLHQDELRLQSWLALQARFRLLRLADRFHQELSASAQKNQVDAGSDAQAELAEPEEEFFDPGSVVPEYERTSRPPPAPSRRPPPPEDA